MHRFWGLITLLLAAATLADCGGPAPGQVAAPPTDAPAPPAATAAPRAEASAAPPATEPPATAAAQAAPPQAGATVLPTTADGIPYGRTAEGYAFLGSPDAPVTLTMYSDFL